MADDPRPDLVAESEVDPRHGQRERLRQRIYRGDNSLLDHELVEYVLALHNRRGDTNARAKQLLEEFGGIGPLIDAAPEVLARHGVSPAQLSALKIASLTAKRLFEAKMEQASILSDTSALLWRLDALAAGHSPDAGPRRCRRPLRIALHDHLVVGTSGHASLRYLGHL